MVTAIERFKRHGVSSSLRQRIRKFWRAEQEGGGAQQLEPDGDDNDDDDAGVGGGRVGAVWREKHALHVGLFPV